MEKAPIFDRNTHERQKSLLEASYREDRLREGNKLVGHFGWVVVLGLALVAALVFGLIQIFTR